MNKYIFGTALMALCLSSCDDFLDVQPEGNTTTTTYFTNDQQSIDAVNGLYERTHIEQMSVVNSSGSKVLQTISCGEEPAAIRRWLP